MSEFLRRALATEALKQTTQPPAAEVAAVRQPAEPVNLTSGRFDAPKGASAQLKDALGLAEEGFKLHPLYEIGPDGNCTCAEGAQCESPGKHPRLFGWQEKASSDPVQITELWTQWPNANIGIATGEPSGFDVLDVDPRNGGAKTLADLIAKHGPLPFTAQCDTGGGGTHYYFKHIPGRRLKRKLGPGLDVKSTGGYVVAGGSNHV